METQKTSEITKEKLNNHVKKRMGSPTPGGSKNVLPAVRPIKKKRCDPDQDCRQEEIREKPDNRHQKPDLLSSIINQKKLSLMQDPEVIQFLQKFARCR